MEIMEKIQELVSRRFEYPVSPDGQWWYLIQAHAMIPAPGGCYEWNWQSSWVQGFDHEIDMAEASDLAGVMLKSAGFPRYFVQIRGLSILSTPERCMP